jgi:D-glycero-alpha-D-manno-heptose-7-phosphate kinase
VKRNPRQVVSASAPSRIDLAGGTLDIWPISVLVPGAVTVNVAVDLRATVDIRARRDGRVEVVSRDRGKRATRSLPLSSRSIDGPLSLLLRVIDAFAPDRGLTLTSDATAPAGAGLGGSSTLAVATAAALDRWSRAGLGRERLLRRVMNLEAVEIGVPTGNQDYLAAIHGGLAAYHHEADGTRREPIPIPAGLQERLVLAYTGRPRQSGFSNWEMFRRFVEGESTAVRRMETIGRIAREMRDALADADLNAAGRLLDEEGRLRYRLAPSVATPELRRAGAAAKRAGALGVKVCGAGGGGCLVALAREGRTERVARAIEAAGGRLLPVRIARRGLRVSERQPGS